MTSLPHSHNNNNTPANEIMDDLKVSQMHNNLINTHVQDHSQTSFHPTPDTDNIHNAMSDEALATLLSSGNFGDDERSLDNNMDDRDIIPISFPNNFIDDQNNYLSLENLHKHNSIQTDIKQITQRRNAFGTLPNFGTAEQPIIDLELGIETYEDTEYLKIHPPNDMISILESMGFSNNRCVLALQKTSTTDGICNVDSAIEYILSDPPLINQSPNEEKSCDDRNTNKIIRNTNLPNISINKKTPIEEKHLQPSITQSDDEHKINHRYQSTSGTAVSDISHLSMAIRSPSPSISTSHTLLNINENTILNQPPISTETQPTVVQDTSTPVISEVQNKDETEVDTSNETSEFVSSLYSNIQWVKNDSISSTVVSGNSMCSVMSDIKMVLIVRKDLKMSTGKIAAQCSHACLGVVLDIIHHSSSELKNVKKMDIDLENVFQVWKNHGQKKIVLQCKNEEEMHRLRDEASALHLPYYVVCDAGHTQVVAGSETVLAIGPYPSVYIDKVTGYLKLY